MFMRENRRKNGVAQPNNPVDPKVPHARQLDPNMELGQSPEDWRFTPSMGSPAQINEDHYQGGVSGNGPYGTSYEAKIPYVGTKAVHNEGTRGLKG